ncbi:hypothetical protein DP113_11655 [Brasilonema octagenarum UFV-E1]|uniref:Uncharacterized protein n=2 Tax=Bromeliae group (in: Brasilonema) TaxID=3398495 RepID=A0A856MBD8_9CYAN|nr:hypothetical protein DP114_11715 [Brasilonema sennae CENA114]QDL14829.1 hypothetical protein DP113_11655 [Brasilonema octagenarum UFV-E1]
MSKGGLSVFLALLSLFFGTFVVMTIVRYISELLFPNKDIESSSELYWEVFVQLIGLRDTGDNANLATKIIGVVTIFLGLVLFSSLVAFITQEFESRLQILRQGQSPVIEENHTLILGFTDRVIDIIQELVVGNESEPDAVVVILSKQEKEEMDNFLRNNLGELKTTRVVTRNGSITNLNELNKVGIKVAKSVIILNDAKTSDPDEVKTLADARVVKAVLAVLAANEEDSLPSIVVELHSHQYRRLAENIAPGAVTTLNEADILARILVQTSRSVGLAAVYLNLVGFEGNEFYFYRPEKGWYSVNFGELPFHFSNGIPVGLRHANATLTIKPSKDYQLLESDEVIILAEDDSSIQFHSQPVVQPNNFNYGDCCKTLERKPEKHLIIGWNGKTPITLSEYAKYLISGSEVNLVVQDLTSQVKAEFDIIAESYSDIKMDALQVNLDSVEQLLRLKPYEYNSISILAGRGENSEEIDAKTLTILLELRQIFREYTAETKNQVTTELIAEIIDSQDTDLVIKAGVKDFILTNQFVSKILAQVSQEPSVMSIYEDLFSIDGSELYIKPISLYFSSKELGRLTFADCVKAAQERDELCLGVKISALAQNKNQNFGIDLVPSLDKPLNLTFDDALITLAEDET